MHLPSLALLAAVAAGAAAAAPAGDPLKSPECGQAIAELEAARAAPAADKKRVETLRQRAANICLGAAPSGTRPARVLQAPIAVPPPIVEVPPRPPALAVPKPPPPPVRIDRPAAIAACDAGGCWTNDGTRLQYVGPNLMGPNGLCTMQGTVVHCP